MNGRVRKACVETQRSLGVAGPGWAGRAMLGTPDFPAGSSFIFTLGLGVGVRAGQRGKGKVEQV